jgi:hypothetical protein
LRQAAKRFCRLPSDMVLELISLVNQINNTPFLLNTHVSCEEVLRRP